LAAQQIVDVEMYGRFAAVVWLVLWIFCFYQVAKADVTKQTFFFVCFLPSQLLLRKFVVITVVIISIVMLVSVKTS
jgi:hypothetical protein